MPLLGSFSQSCSCIAEKAGAVTIGVKPAYTSQLLFYRDEFVFTDCSIRTFFDPKEQLNIDRDINAAVNIKRVGLDVFPTINRRRGNPVVTRSTTSSTSKEVLPVFIKAAERRAVPVRVGVGASRISYKYCQAIHRS